MLFETISYLKINLEKSELGLIRKVVMWKRWLGFWVIAWELFLQDVLAFSLEPLSNQLGFGMWERRDFKNGLLCGKDGTYLR